MSPSGTREKRRKGRRDGNERSEARRRADFFGSVSSSRLRSSSVSISASTSESLVYLVSRLPGFRVSDSFARAHSSFLLSTRLVVRYDWIDRWVHKIELVGRVAETRHFQVVEGKG